MNNTITADDGDRFTPTNPCLRGILKLFSDEKTADVVFEVNGQEKFYAHRLILRTCAPALAEYCDGAEDMTSVQITDVDADMFRHLLYYVYGGTVPDKLLSERSKDIIDLSDRFGIGNLKVEAEGWYVKSTPISLNNFVENLYFSDTKKCALLKEKVMDFLVQNEEEALDKLSQQDVPQSESMLTDFLTASARKKRKTNDHEFKTMSINTLRRKLDHRGSDVDGTREMLISALEKCYNTGDGAVVEGAGTPEINGIYERGRNYDGAPIYKKSVIYPSGEVEFTLFRCRLTDGSRRWYISIVPANTRPGTTRDVDFYTAIAPMDGTTPPRDGWSVVANGGIARAVLPSPKVFVKSSDDNVGDGQNDDME